GVDACGVSFGHVLRHAGAFLGWRCPLRFLRAVAFRGVCALRFFFLALLGFGGGLLLSLLDVFLSRLFALLGFRFRRLDALLRLGGRSGFGLLGLRFGFFLTFLLFDL